MGMTTVYIDQDTDGNIRGIYACDQIGLSLTPHDDEEPWIAAWRMDPLGLEDAFPSLKKWQLWLAALELEPPVFKADVLSLINGMADMSVKDKETVRIMVEDAQEYSRNDPRIDLLAVAMGIPPNQMDDLWKWAAQIEP